LHADGDLRWAKQISAGVGKNEAKDVALTFDGSIIVVGFFSKGAKFGDREFSSAGDTDIFLGKYDSGRSSVLV
jgi:hypothetical protein